MRIRSDLDGVVYVRTSDGGVACLKAGDTVPEGVEVGDHLTKEPEAKESDGAGVKRGRRSAPRPATDG